MSAFGFFGKLPARGDFVRAGLPRSFTDPWDAWLRQVLPVSRQILGEAWEPAWLEAPVWRFALPSGLCGPESVLGLWLPSVDRVGRYFPLTLASTGPDGSVDAGFLTAAEAAGRSAIAEDWPPERLSRALLLSHPRPSPPPERQSMMLPAPPLWWTDGSPRRSAGTLSSPGIPDALTFALMLQDGDPL